MSVYEEVTMAQTTGRMKGSQQPPAQIPGGGTPHIYTHSTSLPRGNLHGRNARRTNSQQDMPDTLEKERTKAPAPPPITTKKMVRSRSPLPLPHSKSLDRSSTMPDLPAIPPKPAPKLLTPATPKAKWRVEDSFNIEEDQFSPSKFVSKFSDKFPLHVRVSKGFYGNTDLTSVSEGDMFNIHFIKKTKVVNVEDGVGTNFKIPLNSAIEFGILYDPNNSRSEALNGFTYEKVSDLLRIKNLPKVLRVGEGWEGSTPDSSVKLNELLIIRGWKKRLQGKLLKVYNPATKEKKELAEDCKGMFTTRPYYVRLFLVDLIGYVSNPFPINAVLYINSESLARIPSYMVTSVVKLKSVSMDTSMVATGAFLSPPEESSSALEIPYDLDIEFQVMRPKEKTETENLYQATRDLFENFTTVTTSTPYVKSAGSVDSSQPVQAAIYSLVREGKELTGVDIVKPSAIYYNTPQDILRNALSKPKSRTLSFCDSVSSDYSVVEVTDASLEERTWEQQSVATDASLEERTQKLETTMQTVEDKVTNLGNFEESTTKISREIMSMRAEIKRMELRGLKAVEDTVKARSEVDELRVVVEQLKRTCASLQTKMDAINQASVIAPGNSPTSPGSSTIAPTTQLAKGEVSDSMYSTFETSCQSNREFLHSLNSAQVLSLLECMGLKKHHETFIDERVDGEILLECDDLLLQEELKITSKLQRTRLLKLIQGRYSAKKILQGDETYMSSASLYAHAK